MAESGSAFFAGSCRFAVSRIETGHCNGPNCAAHHDNVITYFKKIIMIVDGSFPPCQSAAS